MKITFYSSNEEVQKEFGQRIKALRIDADITQRELADQIQLSQHTISNLETGKDVSFSTVIDVLRVLGQLQALDTVIPVQKIRPSQFMSEHKSRERASSKRAANDNSQERWKWGDER